MTMSIARLTAKSSVRYLLKTTMRDDVTMTMSDPTSYYMVAGTPLGRWIGSGLAGINRSAMDPVSSADATALYSRAEHPDTHTVLGRGYAQTTVAHKNGEEIQRHAIAGFDLTFSVPKSISVLWALAPRSVQKEILAAHHEAVNDVLLWLEDTAIRTRTGRGGVAHVATKGAITSAFDHWESRARDPQLHTHMVIANRVQRSTDGAWVTLDSRSIYKAVVAAGEHYNGLLFDHLQHRLGATPGFRAPAGRDRNPRFELQGVDDSLLREFSNRARLIDTESTRLIDAWTHTHGRPPTATIVSKLRQQATLSTREAKDKEPLPLHELSTRWRSRAGRLGFLPNTVVEAATGRTSQRPITAGDLTDQWVAAAAATARELVAQRRATWNRWNLLAEAERVCMEIRCASAADRRAMIDRVTKAAESQCVALNPYRYSVPVNAQADLAVDGHAVFEFHGSRLYSDAGVLADEQLVMDARNDDGGPGLAASVADAALTRADARPFRQTLAPDQRSAALKVLSSGRRLDAVVGPAGSGKTTAMSAIRAAWEEQYGAGSVLALAPAAASADVLGRELGLAAENVAKWLYESVGPGAAQRANQFQILNRRSARSPMQRRRIVQRMAELALKQEQWTFRPNQLVIVDEASMVSTVQFAALVHQARTAGAKIVLTGDPGQLDAIDAGGILGWLDRQGKTIQLTTIRRFKHDWEGPASLLLRKGDVKAVQMYAARGRIQHGDYLDMIDRAYAQWSADVDAGLDSILIAPDNDAVAVLNERAHAELIDNGLVDAEHPVPLSDGLNAGNGDVVIARRNDRHLRDDAGDFIRNGTLIQLTTRPANDGSILGTRLDTGQHIRLTAAYLAESVELGYATTAHRSQGITVDTSHTVLTQGQLTRELFYVGMTRGRDTNTAYVCETSPAPDDAAHEPEEADWVEIIDGVLAAEGAERSAHEVLAAESKRGHTLHTLAAEFDYLAQLAGAENLMATVNALRPEIAADPQASPAWGATVTAWRRARAVSPGVAESVVRQAVLHPDGAEDVASVLHARLRAAEPDPESDLFGENITTSRADLADMVRQVRQLASDRTTAITIDALSRTEPWVRRLVGSLPSSTVARDTNELIERVAVYRDRWLIGTHPDPLGAPPADYEWERGRSREALVTLTDGLITRDKPNLTVAPSDAVSHSPLTPLGLGI